MRFIEQKAEAGIYVKPEDPDFLAEAVMHLYNRPDLRAQYGRSARRFVVQEYSRERKAADYIAVLESLHQASLAGAST